MTNRNRVRRGERRRWALALTVAASGVFTLVWSFEPTLAHEAMDQLSRLAI